MVTNDANAARAEVMAVLDRRVEAARAKDIDWMMSLYSPDIVYFDIIPPHQFVGAGELRRNFLRWFAEYQGDIGLETHDLSVAASGDIAFAHMIHPDSGTRRSGEDVVVWVRSTVCLQRIDDRWLSLRRMSAASSAAAMISLVLRIWSATGPMGTRPPSDPTGPVRCWGAAERMSASSWVGLAPVIWAAAVDPADVPMIRSASVTSNPASNRPAMTPISHALPADPPPPRTNARRPAARTRLVASTRS